MTTSQIKPVTPFTIGAAAEASAGNSAAPAGNSAAPAGNSAAPATADPNAAQPAGAPPPELVEAEQARTTAEMELDSAKNEASQKDKLQRDQVALSTAIRPVQRQTEHQLSKMTELRERIKGDGPKPRGRVFALDKVAAILEKMATPTPPQDSWTTPTPPAPQDAWAKTPRTPNDFKAEPTKPIVPLPSATNYSQGVPYPIQRNYATPIAPPTRTYHSTPEQQAVGYPAQVATGTTSLPPAVSTLAGRGSVWDYAGQKDPTVRDIQYGRARTQALQEWENREQNPGVTWYNPSTYKNLNWENLWGNHLPNMLDNITGVNEVAREAAMPIDPNAAGAAAQKARFNALTDKYIGKNHTDQTMKAMEQAYGSRSKHQDYETQRHQDRLKYLAKQQEASGMNPENYTFGRLKEDVRHGVMKPLKWGDDLVGNYFSDGVEQLMGAAANIDDMRDQVRQGGQNNLDVGQFWDAAKNTVGAATRIFPATLGFGPGTDRERAAAAAAAKAPPTPSKIAPAVPSSSPTNFEDLAQALLPFLGMNNQYGGYDGYGGQRPDHSGNFVELMRVLGNLQRQKP